MCQNCFDSKSVARRVLLAQRRALSKAESQRLSACIQSDVLTLTEWRLARTVALYVSVRNEVATDLLLDAAWGTGKKVLLPRCLPPERGEGLMEFALCPGRDFLAPASFGILEPIPICPAIGQIEGGADDAAAGEEMNRMGKTPQESAGLCDLIIVPGVGFNPAGYRIGYGMGFYDRLLNRPGWVAVRRIGLAYGFQIADFPSDPHDRPMHACVTEKEILCF